MCRHECRCRAARGGLSLAAPLALFLGCAVPQYTPPEPCKPAGPLTLEAVVDLALRNNPDVAAAAGRAEAARAAIDEARSRYWPALDVFGRFTQADMPSRAFGTILDQERFDNSIDFNDPGVTNNWHPGLGGSITLYDGGRRYWRVASAGAAGLAESAALEAVRRNVAYEAARAFFLIHQARDAAAAAEQAATTLETHARLADARREAGVLRASDVLAVRMQLAQARQAAVAARVSAARAEAGLHALLGLSAADKLELVPPAPEAVPDRPELADLIARAHKLRPEIVRAAQSFEAARAQVGEAYAGYFPEVTVFGEFGLDSRTLSSGHANWMWGASVVESLFDVFRTPARVRQALARVAQAHAEGRKTVLEVEQDVKLALLDAEQADAWYAAAEEARQHAAEALRVAEVELAEGRTAPTKVLDRRTALTEARARADAAAYDRRFARVALAHATGEYPAGRDSSAGSEPRVASLSPEVLE